jgi:transposase-like protein
MIYARLIRTDIFDALLLLTESTIPEVAREAKVHPNTIYTWRRDGDRTPASVAKCRSVVAVLNGKLAERREQPAVVRALNRFGLELPLAVADLVE